MTTIHEEISIREETRRKLRLDRNPSFLKSLEAAINRFCEYKFIDAYFALLNLMYDDDKHVHNNVLKKLNFTLYSEASFDIYNPLFFIEEDSVHPIAEELQFQYMAAHPHFLNPHEDCRGCEKEFDDFKNTFGNQHLLFYRAFDSVWNHHQNSEFAPDCISLLLSDNQKAQLKGLEKLKLDTKHQKLLYPYAKEIGTFLKTLFHAYKESLTPPSVVEESKQPVENCPKDDKDALVIEAQKELNNAFAPLAAIYDKVPAEAAPVAKKEKTHNLPTKCPLIKDYSVSPALSKFLDNKDTLRCEFSNATEFWGFMSKLRSQNFDLNFLVDNLPYILAVLSAHESLESSAQKLNDAYNQQKNANENFSETDIQSIHAFVSSSKLYTDAGKDYLSHFEIFIKNRDEFENAVA